MISRAIVSLFSHRKDGINWYNKNMAEEKKKKINYSGAWAEARVLIWNYRWRLVIG
jgi:hypothetical protein